MPPSRTECLYILPKAKITKGINGNELDFENLSDTSTKPTLNYTVYDETNIVRMKMTIRLNENNGTGIAEIIKVISYPEKTDEVNF